MKNRMNSRVTIALLAIVASLAVIGSGCGASFNNAIDSAGSGAVDGAVGADSGDERMPPATTAAAMTEAETRAASDDAFVDAAKADYGSSADGAMAPAEAIVAEAARAGGASGADVADSYAGDGEAGVAVLSGDSGAVGGPGGAMPDGLDSVAGDTVPEPYPAVEPGGDLGPKFDVDGNPIDDIGDLDVTDVTIDGDVDVTDVTIDDDVDVSIDDDDEPVTIVQDRTGAGQLTAGEWNDNKNYDFVLNLIGSNSDWREFVNRWRFNMTGRITAVVTDGGTPVNNALVELLDNSRNTVYTARTDNSGTAHLFSGLRSRSQDASAAYIRVNGEHGETREINNATEVYAFSLPASNAPRGLDLMFVIDTTGSMGDELEYLKTELDDVIRQVRRSNEDIDVRLSVNVYRDIGDEYVVRPMPFSNDINSQLEFLRNQRADGGGDYEEAVEEALADALERHDWNDGATAKLMFLVLDAPPHNTESIVNEMHRLLPMSAAMGVRIIPVASSGVDKDTEFLLRTMSMTTGGTYVFLTDDSGIGESHIEPTIGPYEVELLNELIVRVIGEYLR